MAYSRDQLMTALRNADASGDTDGAKRIAQMISSAPTSTPQPQQDQSLLQSAEQAVRGVVSIPFDVAQGVSDAATSVGRLFGADSTPYQIPRPVDRPTDQYAQVGEAIGGYLVPLGRAAKAVGATADLARGVSLAGNMAIGSVAEAANQQGDFAQNAATNAALNLGAQGALSAAGRLLAPRASQEIVSAAINSADDVSRMAKTGAGRNAIANQAADVSDDVARAAEIAGVDVNSLTPGMRSGSRGVAQAEGILASKPGIAQDAHTQAFGEIQGKFNSALDDLGAEVGTASEKSRAIKQRVLSGIDSMKSSEKSAWDSVRSTMPESRGRMANTNATIQGDISAGMPITPEMKQLVSAYNKSGKAGITFDAMKAWRGKLADAEQKYTRSGESNMARRMGDLRDAATEDMKAMAQSGGFLDQWTAANDLSKARFAAQKQAEAALGKDLATDSLVANGVKALQNAPKNGTGKFHQMIGSLPESERAPAIASILQDAMSQGIRGGKSDAAGISHIASILTPQNIAAINRHSPEIGKIAGAYGELAKAATKPLRYVEQTGRSVPALQSLEQGFHPAVNAVLSAVSHPAVSAITGTLSGGPVAGVLGAIGSVGAKAGIEKLAASRSGRYAIEKAIMEATRAVRDGASSGAVAAAERRFMSNKAAVKAIRETVGNEDFQRLVRAGIVSSLSGMSQE